MLDSEFDCRCEPADLLSAAGIEGALDTPEEFEIAFRWLAEQAQGAAASRSARGSCWPPSPTPSCRWSRISKARSRPWSDHDLIAALSGDREAQAALQDRVAAVEITAPDHTPPADEFLVLDADASQNYAINAVLGGQDLVIKGPPGTGKSQTITNLVSTLVARGKRVLFVAEKRAAIDAVLRRLEDVGLGDLVLDLHGGAGSKREIAQRWRWRCRRIADRRPALEAEHRLLDARRERAERARRRAPRPAPALGRQPVRRAGAHGRPRRRRPPRLSVYAACSSSASTRRPSSTRASDLRAY